MEKGAQQAVEQHYEILGYSIQDVSHLKLGWDVEATSSSETLRIEVKGRSGSAIAAELTPNEYRRMRVSNPSFRLCVVTNTLEPDMHIHDFGWDPSSGQWVTSDGTTLIVDEALGARVRA